jgi:thioredoxin 2
MVHDKPRVSTGASDRPADPFRHSGCTGHPFTMAILTCSTCGARNRVDESRAASATPVCARCHTPLSSRSQSSPVTLTDATLQQALRNAGDLPVLLDCWAPWCGPCRMLAPTLDQLAGESNGRYVIAKLNTDENPRTAQQFQISAIPCMLLFHRGQLVDKLVGLQPKSAIADRLVQFA